MSEAKSTKGSKAKGSSSAKPESKAKITDTVTKTTDAKAKEGGESVSAKPSEAASSDGGTDAGKSARESTGGTSDAHYGYFSSVRTPAYRSGWDSIWGKNGDGEQRPARSTRKPRKKPQPITLSLDLDALPAALKDGLVEIARTELKKSRVSYERRDKAGAVDWRIVCRVDR